MALTASCPSCGAPVVFRSASSVFAVCDYCSSTLVRHDQALEDIGKMAALVEDRSPLQLGAEGSYRGVHFALIGRIQIRYGEGLWNEWHLLFDDMRTGWLSEAAGEYVLSFVQPVQEAVPAFDEWRIGERFVLAGQSWVVSNLERAECVAGQGELPFKVGAGYPVNAVDLRNGRNFATLDYSETAPLLFVGEAVDFGALAMNGLRDGMAVPTRKVDTRVFRCPACGAPMQARDASIQAVGCASCGAVVDTSDETLRLLSKALKQRDGGFAPRLPLGSKGRLAGQAVELIGFLVKRSKVDGIAYHWREYLLAGENGSYRWLTEYNNHWTLVDVLSDPPNVGSNELADVRWQGERYRHFSTAARAEVVHVEGEFTWRVRRGEINRVTDYVAPPHTLSRETDDKTLSWSLGTYVEPAVIAAAFGLKSGLPAPIGVGACQPNPWAEGHRKVCRLFWKLALVAVLVQAWFVIGGGGSTLLRQTFDFAPNSLEESRQTGEFRIDGKPRKIAVRNQTNLDNNWAVFELLLVDKNTGQAWPAAREVSYYHGYDDGYWSEGDNADEVVFLNVPPGTYYLTVDAELAPEKPLPLRSALEVRTAGAGWSNFVLVMIFLVAFPVFTRLRHHAFEVRRWADSDHAPDDDEDD